MKKLCFVLLSSTLVSVTAFAKAAPAANEVPVVVEPFKIDRPIDNGTGDKNDEKNPTPLQICLAAPLQVPGTDMDVCGLRLNIFFGMSRRVMGLDLGLAGYSRDLQGLSIQGANWVDNNFMGLQLGALFNVVGNDALGCQLAGLLNYTKAGFTGVQLAALNYGGSLAGVQIGAVNGVTSPSVGLQVGVVNTSLTDYTGCSIGALNYADKMVGLQLGVVNLATVSGRGVQLGVFNAATAFTGLQIGVLNVMDNAVVPVLPIVNGSF